MIVEKVEPRIILGPQDSQSMKRTGTWFSSVWCLLYARAVLYHGHLSSDYGVATALLFHAPAPAPDLHSFKTKITYTWLNFLNNSLTTSKNITLNIHTFHIKEKRKRNKEFVPLLWPPLFLIFSNFHPSFFLSLRFPFRPLSHLKLHNPIFLSYDPIPNHQF